MNRSDQVTPDNRLQLLTPWRSLGIFNSSSPASVANRRGRDPLRSVVRVSLRSQRSAPICSATINSCITTRAASRTRSTPSPARNASNGSDRTDCDRAIGEGSPSGALAGTHRESRRWPHQRWIPSAHRKASPHGTPLRWVSRIAWQDWASGPIHGALQLALVHLRAALDTLVLGFVVELVVGAPTGATVRP